MNHPLHPIATREIPRRQFFDRVGTGMLGAALSHLLIGDGAAETQGADLPAHPTDNDRLPDLRPRPVHFPARAKAVIHLCMQGGPSQVDLFDPKPQLTRYHNKSAPRSLTQSAAFAADRRGKLMASPWRFARHGSNGIWVSELLPHLSRQVDNLTIVRSMFGVHSNHEPAIYFYQSGQTFPGHPVFGSWIVYGLGSVNQNLPAYVVLADPLSRLPTNGVENWQAGYLPPLYQGTRMRSRGTPLLNLRPDYNVPADVQARKRELLARFDRWHKRQRPGQSVFNARIRNYELAARMQLEATRILDFTNETAATLQLYGIGRKPTDDYGRRCLLARRLIENGVRFVQLYTRGQMWDNHRDIRTSLREACDHTDLPVAGLLQDLRRRGLLDSTLVLWGGEFGRLPLAQVRSESQFKTAGRDHGPYGFTSWAAGAGLKPGYVHGSTDEIGYAAVEDRVSIHDWHATILHLLGLDHRRLVYNRHGLQERLTHTFEANVVRQMLA